ncbi:MAG: hypothetical protein U0638_12475 [Phycisphaerales bacterium]
MPPWIAFVSGLIGAVIGAAASVFAQVVNHRSIQKREDRDKLRTACIEFAESAFRLVQRAELALIYAYNKGPALADASSRKATEDELLELVMDAGAAQDQLSTAFCKVTMLRHTDRSLDDGLALYKALMAMPMAIGDEGCHTLDDLTKMAERKRLDIKDWLQEQSKKLA